MSLRSWFRRSPPPPSAPPTRRLPALDDSPVSWEPGDEARCVRTVPWACLWTGHPLRGPECGKVYRVRRVTFAGGAQFLIFPGFGDRSFHAVEFEKLQPPKRAPHREEVRAFDFRKLLGRRPKEVVDA